MSIRFLIQEHKKQKMKSESTINTEDVSSQAQQPSYGLNELAQMIMSDCGISTINNDALFNRILDRLINASDLQIRPDVLCGGCKGIRSSDCPDCNGSGKMTDPRTQAQQDETCPECGRKKAKSADDCAAGLCPKWYAIRDKEAAKDCQNVSQAQQPSCTYTWNCPRCGSGKCIDESDASQAQQTQEPVAWMNPYGGLLHVRETGLEKATFTIPLYLQSQAQQSQWISVDERLPETKEMIISARKRADGTWGLDLNYWTVSNRFAYKYTHWMPLPPAPEGVE